jgi:hypothetical protein
MKQIIFPYLLAQMKFVSPILPKIQVVVTIKLYFYDSLSHLFKNDYAEQVVYLGCLVR